MSDKILQAINRLIEAIDLAKEENNKNSDKVLLTVKNSQNCNHQYGDIVEAISKSNFNLGPVFTSIGIDVKQIKEEIEKLKHVR